MPEVIFILLRQDVDTLAEAALEVSDLQTDGAGSAVAADDNDKLAAEELHRGLAERLQAGGVAVAHRFEGAGAPDIEDQAVGGIGDEGAAGVAKRHRDEGQVVAVGTQRAVTGRRPHLDQAMEVDKVVVPKSNKRDDRYITKQEMQQLWGWFKRTKNKWVGYFMFSYLHGGINLADMVDLRFNDFWFAEGGFVFTRKKTAHKTNRKVAVPATTWTQELFDTLNIEPTKNKRVFAGLEYDGTDADYQRLKSGVHTNIDRSLAKACKELEINKKVTMTTARHSFATIATKEGIPYVMVENAMGHTLGSVASHYIGSFSVEEMRPDFEKLL